MAWRFIGAAFVVAIVIALVWRGLGQPAPLLASSLSELGHRGEKVSNTLVLAAQHEATAGPRVGLDSEAGPVRVRLQPGAPGVTHYKVSLQRVTASTPLGEVETDIQPGGFVAVYLNAAALGSGQYRLQLTGPKGEAESFPFELALGPSE